MTALKCVLRVLHCIILFSLSLQALSLQALPLQTGKSAQNRGTVREAYSDVERILVPYVLSEMKSCIQALPGDEYDMYIKIIGNSVQERVLQGQNLGLENKRVLLLPRAPSPGVIQLFREMPFDQRLAIASTIAGFASVPGYLFGAAQSWSETEIEEIKNEAKMRLNSEKINATKQWQNSSVITPPRFTRKGSIQGVKTQKTPTVGLHTAKSTSAAASTNVRPNVKVRGYDVKGKDIDIVISIDHDNGNIILEKNKLNFHRRNSASSASKMAEELVSPAKKAKTPNEAVSRLLSFTGAGISFLYLPTALNAVWRGARIVDNDLSKYKRRGLDHQSPGRMPAVTCKAIKKGDRMQILNRSMMKRSFKASATLSEVGKHSKMAGIGGIGIAWGFIMHNMAQKRDIDDSTRSLAADEETSLSKRWRPGPGSILFSSVLAGTALSKAGFGVPHLHPTISEEESEKGTVINSLETNDIRRRGVLAQVHHAFNDKVAIAMLSMGASAVAVKSGLLEDLHELFKGSSSKNSTDVSLRRHNDNFGKRGFSRSMTFGVGTFAGIYLAQHTGSLGQRKENKDYIDIINTIVRRKQDDVLQPRSSIQGDCLVKYSGKSCGTKVSSAEQFVPTKLKAVQMTPGRDVLNDYRRVAPNNIYSVLQTQAAFDKRDLFNTALFGGLIGVTGAATMYAKSHDEPGTRKVLSVPTEFFKKYTPLDEQRKNKMENKLRSGLSMRKRGIYNSLASVGSKFAKKLPAWMKTSKAQGIGAIGGGLALSTVAALMESPKKQIKKADALESKQIDQHLEYKDKDDIKAKESSHFHRRATLSPFKAVKNLHADVVTHHGPMAGDGLIVGSIAAVAGATGLLKRDIEQRCSQNRSFTKLERRGNFMSKAFTMVDVVSLAVPTGAILGGVGKKIKGIFTKHEGVQEHREARDAHTTISQKEISVPMTKRKILGMSNLGLASLSTMGGSFLAAPIKNLWKHFNQIDNRRGIEDNDTKKEKHSFEPFTRRLLITHANVPDYSEYLDEFQLQSHGMPSKPLPG